MAVAPAVPPPGDPPAILRQPLAWALFALVVLTIPAVAWVRQSPPPPVLSVVPDFALVDQRGAPVMGHEYADHIVVLDFIFTRCPDVCPLMSARMAALQTRLPDRPFGGKPIRFVSVSVDPEYDTPAVLTEYGERYGADPNRWTMMTGPRAEVERLSAGLMQGLERAANPGQTVPDILHSQRFVLIDGDGQLRGSWRTEDDDLDDLVAAALTVSRE